MSRVQTQSDIRAILGARGLSPKHRFGQNFLVDQNLLRKLVDASGIGEGSLVVEIGPGTGTMSEEILARGAELVAIELDRDLAAHLREHFAANPRFTLVEGDCLDGKRALNAEALAKIGGRSFTLVANLPYQAASPVMAICATLPQCLGQFVTIQREVGDRLRAQPNSGEYGPLTIMVQAFCEVEQIAVLPPGCFWPPPEVTSAMLALRPRATPAIARSDAESFGEFVHTLFSKRRKQLGAILGRARAWPEGIDPNARPEALSIADLARLWRA
jgi:16S rRNA (adenine1518-N6/adenine1519-N6)-dimethyltransferase